jgi:hypothetical protein
LGLESNSGEVKEMLPLTKIVSLIFILILASVDFSQTKSFDEPLKIKIIKYERLDEGPIMWRLNLTFKDASGRLYHVWNHCNPSVAKNDSGSCANYFIPQVGSTYEVTNHGGISVEFKANGMNEQFGITSIEIDECK